jgi:hypothetical protein
MHLVGKLRAHGTTLVALESSDTRRAELAASGIEALPPSRRDEFLSRPMDAVAVNASGGSLDPHAVALIAANERLRVVCGSENLVMPDHAAGSDALRAARKAYCPTELGGMMGYLTAVEEYLARVENVPFDLETLLAAAHKLDGVAFDATRRVIAQDFAISFEEAVKLSADG